MFAWLQIRWLLAPLLLGCAGMLALGAYEGTPAREQAAPRQWPTTTALKLAPKQPTVLMFVHPHCPCTLASVEQLLDVLARHAARATLVVYEPADAAPVWAHGALWQLATQHPDRVQLVRDPDARLAQDFQASTSGMCLVYGTDERLRFAGGLTINRGHRGANEGLQTLAQALADPADARAPQQFPVFGCALYSAKE